MKPRPGLARTSPGIQTGPPRPGEARPWADREILLQCSGCGTSVTGELIRGELSFHAMPDVAATWTIAQEAWQAAEALGRTRVADKLLSELERVRERPVEWIHRPCGGALVAFDTKAA
jgi:hypothetical protein